jgi:parallel beta-helix repeat protein
MHRLIKTILPMLAFAWAGTSEAATYYVRNGGNDSADGRTHATAWASLNRVNSHAFAAGDSVLLQEGSRFVNQKLRVDWGGTATQRAVIGAYYLDGSTPRRGYRTARPTIDGEDRIPTGHYDGLVVVAGVDRVRIENLQVLNSEGRAIGISDSDEAEVVGCSVRNTYSNGIHFLRSPRSLAENNFVAGQGVGNREDGAPWGSSIEFVASPDGVIRNNVVSEVFGEGLNAHSGSDRTLIERNYVHGARAVGIYVDSAADITVRRNIVVGTSNSTYWRTGSTVGAGIAVNNELYHYPEGGGSLSVNVQAKRAKIYGNLVAYTSTGLSVWGQLSSTSFDGLLIYNNTFVDNNTQVNMGVKPTPSSKFINNILLSLSSGTSDLGTTNLNGMVARNNYFSQGNPGGDFVHTGNRFTGLKLAKMSGWRAVTSRDQISWRDFVVASGSTVIGAGDDEPRRTSDVANDYVLDHNKAEHGAPMDMGGLTFATPVGRRPMPPTNLSGT